MRHIFFLCAIAAGCALAACSTRQIVSQPLQASTASDRSPCKARALHRRFEKGGLVYALPTTILRVEGAAADTAGGALKIGVTTERVPDTRAVFQACYRGNPWTDDDIGLVATKNMLLSSGRASIEDKTRAVLIEIAKAVSAPFKLQMLEEPGKAKPFVSYVSLSELAKGPVALPNSLHLQMLSPTQAEAAKAFAEVAAVPECRHSLCFRPLIPVRVCLSPKSGTDACPGTGSVFLIAATDESTTLGVDLNSMTFVKRETTVTFDEGLLTNVEIKKPSSALAIASLPLDILKALISAPTEIIMLRIDYSSEEKKLAEAELARLKAEQALRDSERKQQSPDP